ncbi:hypothetical protein LIER_41544 [Lithospermum erythrorhizon]|uniref:Uncharacterized protein n=1 Tax=Lithospermum erythrorhizon TaxID=34254 RepID=A0AAV3RCY7_LITER
MDEQGINSIFANRLNPSLYDKRVYVKECPYEKVVSPKPRLESPTTRTSNDESSLSANSPVPQMTAGNKVVSKIIPNNDDDDVKTSFPKDKMSQSLENQMDNNELRPRDNRNHTECSRVGEMSLLPVAEQTAQEPAPPATQVQLLRWLDGRFR